MDFTHPFYPTLIPNTSYVKKNTSPWSRGLRSTNRKINILTNIQLAKEKKLVNLTVCWRPKLCILSCMTDRHWRPDTNLQTWQPDWETDTDGQALYDKLYRQTKRQTLAVRNWHSDTIRNPRIHTLTNIKLPKRKKENKSYFNVLLRA